MRCIKGFPRRPGLGASPRRGPGRRLRLPLPTTAREPSTRSRSRPNNVGGVPGDGVWLWIELNSNGSGDYIGSDCIHTGPAGLNGAGHQRGDVTWTDSAGKLTISGVGLVGGQFPVTVVVPDRYGHYVGPSDNFIQGFALGSIGGTAQVQIAP
jgi:hypothetical protein